MERINFTLHGGDEMNNIYNKKQYEAMYTIGISKFPPPPPLTIEFYAAVSTVYSCKELESVNAGTMLANCYAG